MDIQSQMNLWAYYKWKRANTKCDAVPFNNFELLLSNKDRAWEEVGSWGSKGIFTVCKLCKT